jgi:hypothetical protein
MFWTPAGAALSGWHHVAIVFVAGASATQIYVDGALRVSGSLNYAAGPFTRPLEIGHDVFPSFGGTGARGGLDDFRIYNRVLTATEIAVLANTATRPGGCAI